MSENLGTRKLIIFSILKGVRTFWESENLGKLRYDCFKLDFIIFKVDIISIENNTLSRTSS